MEIKTIKIIRITHQNGFFRADMQLVRFRGLVQNMLDPEIYLESYQTKTDTETLTLRKGKFRDNLKLNVSVTVVKSIVFFSFYPI